MGQIVWCPHCDFSGTETDVDEHRADFHDDGPQAGPKLRNRPRS